MTNDEIIAVVQAHKDGKRIEYRERSESVWLDANCPSWSFYDNAYRVKPDPKKPREGYVHVSDFRDGSRSVSCPEYWIHVREVL